MPSVMPPTERARRTRPALLALASGALLGLVLSSTGCAAARQGEPAASPAPATPPGASLGAPGPRGSLSGAPAPADAAASAPATVNGSGMNEERAGASGDFERAARMVDTASSDCRQACRALAKAMNQIIAGLHSQPDNDLVIKM